MPLSSGLNARILGLLYGGIVGSVLFVKSVKNVPAGHVGVLDQFGDVQDNYLVPGLHFMSPLVTAVPMSVKTRSLTFDCQVPTNEGLLVNLMTAIQFSVSPESCITLYKTVGLRFEDVLLSPMVHAALREAGSNRSAKDMYSLEGRRQMHDELVQILRASLEKHGINVHEVHMAKVVLPPKLTNAIERKLEMEQESQRMNHVLEREKLEAQRKKIEAQGIQDLQQIVRKGIDDNLLRWKGIEATQALADSQNAKVIVVGSGKDGLPLILGGK